MDALVTFALDESSHDAPPGFVRRKGRIDRLDVSPEDLHFALERFQPISLSPGFSSILDGKFGLWDRLSRSPDGKGLLTSALIPKWIDDVFRERQVHLLANFNRSTKQFMGLYLSREPFPSADLLATFADEGRAAAERLDSQLALTPLGRLVLEDRRVAAGR